MIELCKSCSIEDAMDYVKRNREIKMETISRKRALHKRIKELLEREGDDLKSFPVTFSFKEGMGDPVFSFTIERTEEDHFIDDKGQKWVRA